jgi:16S rRNA (uracil1498-N3)-methyltransferase
MSDRFFIDEPLSPGRATLAGPEAHHLIHVMRATPGTQVILFDGSGYEFAAVVQQIGRDRVELSVGPGEPINRELPAEVILGVPLPKGDRQKWLVEKTVELGLTRIVPLRTQRAVAQPVDQALTRLRRTVIEASKQCGRNRLMQIDGPMDWPDFIAARADVSCRLLAHPQPQSDQPSLILPPNAPVLLAVGPEGGFTNEEVVLASAAGWRTVDLGPRILRVETAALMLAALVVGRCSQRE